MMDNRLAWKITCAAILVASNAYLFNQMGWLESATAGNPVVAAPTSPEATAANLVPPVEQPVPPTVVAEVTDQLPSAEPATVTPADARLADLVVLLSVDGLRPDAVFPMAPTIRRLMTQGASATNTKTISKASTLPSHASMVSGVDVDQHGLSFNAYRPERGHIQYPTIFSEAQKAGLATAVFVGKRKLRHLLNPDTVTHFEVGGVFCTKVTKIAIPYVEKAESGLVFIHFSDPDSAGHRHGWMSDEYSDAVRRADRCVRKVTEALKRRGQIERTVLLVTSDHGGHDHNHGTRRADDRNIPFLLWGGPVKPHTKIRRRVFNTDAAATIFHALAIQPPSDIVGRPVLEAFLEP